MTLSFSSKLMVNYFLSGFYSGFTVGCVGYLTLNHIAVEDCILAEVWLRNELILFL